MKVKKDTNLDTLKEIVDIVCDVCSKSCMYAPHGQLIDLNYANISAHWGPSSIFFHKEFNIDICEDCFEKVLKLLKKNRKMSLNTFIKDYKDPLDPSNKP